MDEKPAYTGVMYDTIHHIYASYMRAKPFLKGYDSETRDPSVMIEFFKQAGIPRNNLPAISVTGSKGKGSTALFCSAMLQGLEYSVGLVTSPHLVDFCERIRVNGEAIAEDDFVRIVNSMAPRISEFDRRLPYDKFLGPTGLLLACALRYFAEVGVTAVVLEAGRGGRFDDTRIYENAVTCLTPVMSEHLDRLGPTISEVAWNKAGLIKPRSSVICAPQVGEAEAIIAGETRQKQARLLQVGRDILYEHSPILGRREMAEVAIPSFDFQERFILSTPAGYQAANAAMAAGAVLALSGAGKFAHRDMAGRLPDLRLPGRCEIVFDHPVVIVDGAINRISAIEFRESVVSEIKRPLVLVAALPQDKDYRGFLEELAPLADTTIITRANNPILHFNDDVVRIAREISGAVMDLPDGNKAFDSAVDLAGSRGMVWVVGTQSLVRDALLYWNQDNRTVWR